jgi:Family of unknown function (DUF6448)
MPPHCDSLDGPVVRAARTALEQEDVDLVLPYVHAPGEAEVRDAFDLAVKARAQGADAREVADRFFLETVVRVHRAGEGAPYTGLKPAGLDVGPVIPLAERAIATGDAAALAAFFSEAVDAEVKARLAEVMDLKEHGREGVPEARRYVSAMLGLQVWAHKLHGAIHAAAHEPREHPHS